MFDRFSSFLFLSVYILFYTFCCQSCVAPCKVIQDSLFVDSGFLEQAFLFACEQALRDALAVRREKEGQLSTTSLEFEYLHRKSRCEMLIGVDDISNDVSPLGMCFSMFVYIRADWRNLTARSTGATGELEVEFKFQRRSCKFSFLFPPHSQTARAPRRACSLASRTWIPDSLC